MLDPHGAPAVRAYDGITDVLLLILNELHEIKLELQSNRANSDA
jgi:hypothetical protein